MMTDDLIERTARVILNVTFSDGDTLGDYLGMMSSGDGGEEDAGIIARAALAIIAPAVLDMAAKSAKTGWISADYNLVGIADADMAMRLCEHVEAEILAIKAQFEGDKL